MRGRSVTFVYFDGCEVLDFAGPMQAFHEANSLGASYILENYGVKTEAMTAQGLQLGGLKPLPPPDQVELAIVPGYPVETPLPPAIISWLKECQNSGAVLCSVCTGAFALAQAGVLDGHRCTTHWKHVEALQRLCPTADVRAERLFVISGKIITSAGIASGIDMALALVERDYGPLMASRVAREMVVYVRRNSRYKQQSVFLAYRTHLHPGVHALQDWLVSHPSNQAGLAELSGIASMSPRHLTRVFREATGISIHEYRTVLRLEHARGLLVSSELTIEAIANESGFADARQFRRLWQEANGAPPSKSRAILVHQDETA